MLGQCWAHDGPRTSPPTVMVTMLVQYLVGDQFAELTMIASLVTQGKVQAQPREILEMRVNPQAPVDNKKQHRIILGQ